MKLTLDNLPAQLQRGLAGAYLVSKLLILAVISAVQSLILVGIGILGRKLPATGSFLHHLPLVELETRYELSPDHAWAEHGFDETMSIDGTLHSLFGASKVAADVLTQEYGRYFGMKTACFRGGCLTGSGHSPTQLHGFLAYLVKCAVTDTPYTVFGYKGKQVRDNIHSRDLVEAFWCVFQRPVSGEVFNIGGSRHSNCSMMEAITIAESLTGRPMRHSYTETNRVGDHKWWVSDVRKFQQLYPEWSYKYDIRAIMEDIHFGLSERLTARVAAH